MGGTLRSPQNRGIPVQEVDLVCLELALGDLLTMPAVRRGRAIAELGRIDRLLADRVLLELSWRLSSGGPQG